MRTRIELHKILKSIEGVQACYFCPPEGLNMKYPCIVYDYVQTNPNHADNLVYLRSKQYRVVVIDEDPDSEIPDRVEGLPFCSSDRKYVSDGLNHFPFTLFW